MMNFAALQLPILVLLLIVLSLTLLSSCAVHNKKLGEEKWVYKDHRISQKTFKSSDGVIRYKDEGEGDVILLLHGIPSSSWLYRKMIDDLLDNGYRVIAPDMLGFGNSDSPKDYHVYASEEHAKRLLELMDHLQIQNWTHVLHDGGGQWTWELFEKAPSRVSNLVILNTIIFEEGFNPPLRMKPGFFAKLSMWLYRNGVTTNFLLKQLFKKGLTQNVLTKEAVQGYKWPLLEKKTRGMYYFFTQTCNALPNYEAVIQQIDVPTIVIWGKHDDMLQLVPQKDKIIQGFKLEEKDIHLLDAKHFIQEEKPKEINQLILDFLKTNQK